MIYGKTRLKHVERLTEINQMRNFAPCWLYSANILAMHGPMNVKWIDYSEVSHEFSKFLQYISARMS